MLNMISGTVGSWGFDMLRLPGDALTGDKLEPTRDRLRPAGRPYARNGTARAAFLLAAMTGGALLLPGGKASAQVTATPSGEIDA